MMGYYGAHAAGFLRVVGVLTMLFAGPMLIHPLGWARALRWRIPDETDLAVYFGRCLGGVVTVLGALAWVAAARPGVTAFYFQLMFTIVAVNIGVHIWGAFRRIQPATETWEIAVWVALFAAGLIFYPA